MTEYENYLAKINTPPNPLSRFINPNGEKRAPTITLEKAEVSARSCTPMFDRDKIRWELIGYGTLLLNSALISEEIGQVERVDSASPVSDVFNLFFQPHLLILNENLKIWREIRAGRGENNPNHNFELEWEPLFGRYQDYDPIVFAVRIQSSPGFNHSKD